MALPRTIEGREQAKFVECPDNTSQVGVATVICNVDQLAEAISSGFGVESDFADGNISAAKAIYKTTSGVALASNNLTEDEATVIGVTLTAALDGEKIKYKIIGNMTDSSFAFGNNPVYLGVNGNMTNISPTTGYRTQIGTASADGELQINIEEPIIL